MLSDRCPVCLSVTLVYCGQPFVWIKMKLGMEVGLSPSSPPKTGTPNFRPMSVVAKRLDGSRCHLLGTIGLGSGRIVLHGDPAGQRSPTPSFRLMSIVPKRSPISATAEHAFCLFVNQIFRERLNGFAPNSQGRTRLVPGSDEVECQGQRSKVKGQGSAVPEIFHTQSKNIEDGDGAETEPSAVHCVR